MPANHLSNLELCDSVNYILGLPVRKKTNGGFARRDGLNPCVVSSWGGKKIIQLEAWMEFQLRNSGILPERRHQRRPNSPPSCFLRWLNMVSH